MCLSVLFTFAVDVLVFVNTINLDFKGSLGLITYQGGTFNNNESKIFLKKISRSKKS